MFQYLEHLTLETPLITRDEYKQEIIEYVNSGFIDVAINHIDPKRVISDGDEYIMYDTIGITLDTIPQNHSRIDGRYEVVYSTPTRRWNKLFLKEVEDA